MLIWINLGGEILFMIIGLEFIHLMVQVVKKKVLSIYIINIVIHSFNFFVPFVFVIKDLIRLVILCILLSMMIKLNKIINVYVIAIIHV